MIGHQPTGTINGVVISAVTHEGLSVTVDGQPGRLAVVTDDGQVVAMGQQVAREVRNVAVNCYRATLQGKGHLRVLSEPIVPGRPTRNNDARRGKLIACGEASPATKHLTKACSDCPLRRDALNGWLGAATPEDYAKLCHSDSVVECHVHAGSRCAGLAIYRRNACKSQPKAHELPPDHETIFSNRMEFIEHHSALPGWRAKSKEAERTDMTAKREPTGYVAVCQCGATIGALDISLTPKQDAGFILGRWLSDGCAVSPRFTGTWSTTVQPCKCDDAADSAKTQGREACSQP